MIVSVRLENKSTFVNLDNLISNASAKRIRQVYRAILQNMPAYEPSSIGKLANYETTLFNILYHERARWVEIALSVLTLGIYLIYYYIQKNPLNREHEAFIRSLEQAKSRQNPKEVVDRPDEIKKLEAKRLSDPSQELERLRQIPRIKASMEGVEFVSDAQRITYGHSLELQEALRETHYVINHGQSSSLMFLNIVSRQLKHLFDTRAYQAFEPLRHDIFLNSTRDVAYFTNTFFRVNDHKFRESLISGDCCLESTVPGESALYFFVKNGNVVFPYHQLYYILKHYIYDDRVVANLKASITELRKKFNGQGNLYSICVPKEEFSSSCYFSWPYGSALRNQEELFQELDSMQAGTYSASSYPQIRVVTKEIRPEKGYYVVLNSTLSDEELLELEEGIKFELDKALCNLTRLVD